MVTLQNCPLPFDRNKRMSGINTSGKLSQLSEDRNDIHSLYDKMMQEFDGEMILLMLTIYILAYILFLGFVKFYRRNTLEDFMTLVVDKNLLAKNVE